jgi:hypothetical protein
VARSWTAAALSNFREYCSESRFGVTSAANSRHASFFRRILHAVLRHYSPTSERDAFRRAGARSNGPSEFGLAMIKTQGSKPTRDEASPSSNPQSLDRRTELECTPDSGPGASFRFERDLVRVLSGSLGQLFPSPRRQLSVLHEVAFGSVIADMLFGLTEELDSAPNAPGVFPTGLVDSFLVHAIAKRELGVATLRERLGVPQSSFDRSFRKLQKCGLIALPYSDFALLTDWASALLRTDVVAIEAKLTRWRVALEQARSYQDFSDRSYVALDARRVQVTASMESAFEQSGVGLIMCWADHFSIVVEATRRVLLTPRRIQSVLRIAARSIERDLPTHLVR